MATPSKNQRVFGLCHVNAKTKRVFGGGMDLRQFYRGFRTHRVGKRESTLTMISQPFALGFAAFGLDQGLVFFQGSLN